jgi:hypothetical protein
MRHSSAEKVPGKKGDKKGKMGAEDVKAFKRESNSKSMPLNGRQVCAFHVY